LNKLQNIKYTKGIYKIIKEVYKVLDENELKDVKGGFVPLIGSVALSE
jgi:bacteriocin-like protein